MISGGAVVLRRCVFNLTVHARRYLVKERRTHQCLAIDLVFVVCARLPDSLITINACSRDCLCYYNVWRQIPASVLGERFSAMLAELQKLAAQAIVNVFETGAARGD